MKDDQVTLQFRSTRGACYAVKNQLGTFDVMVHDIQLSKGFTEKDAFDEARRLAPQNLLDVLYYEQDHLNAAMNLVNEEITAFGDALEEFAPGTPMWLEKTICTEDGEDPDHKVDHTGWVLGWDRKGRLEYQLYVRRVGWCVETDTWVSGGSGGGDFIDAKHAPMGVRVAIVKHRDTLLLRMIETVRAYTAQAASALATGVDQGK